MPINSFTMSLSVFTFSYCEWQHFLSLPHPTILLTFLHIDKPQSCIYKSVLPLSLSCISNSMMNIQTYPEVLQMFHTISCYLVPSSIFLSIFKLNTWNVFLAVFPSHLQQPTNQNLLFMNIFLTFVFTISIVSVLISSLPD